MPISSIHGKDTILSWLKEKNDIKIILDVGCGEGTYPNLFKNNGLFADSKIFGIEAWTPYISTYNLEEKYYKIFNEDVRNFDWNQVENLDLVIFGDVLEHMSKDESQQLVNAALSKTKYIIISIPIKHMPQDAVGGNPFEIHVKDNWTHQEVLVSFPNIIKFGTTKKIGVYWIEGQK